MARWVDEHDLDKDVVVQETLARALGMFSTTTSPLGIVRYLGEQIRLPKPYYGHHERLAIRYFVAVVVALAPPEDKRMSFTERPVMAVRDAVPFRFGEALDTAVEVGISRRRIGAADTAWEAGELIRGLLEDYTVEIARQLLTLWERNGDAYRL